MTVMERFKVADHVLILAQFAHLYPSNRGVVVHIKPDPFRATFNEYTLQFPDGSTGELFEFQLVEAEANYTTQTAVVAFDSEQQSATRELRGQRQDRQIILRTPDFDI